MEDSPIKNDKPTERIVITDCGELGDEEIIEEKRQKDEFGDAYESHPSGKLAKPLSLSSNLSSRTNAVSACYCEDDDADVHDPAVAMRIAEELKTIGTSLFKKGNLEKSQHKCR